MYEQASVLNTYQEIWMWIVTEARLLLLLAKKKRQEKKKKRERVITWLGWKFFFFFVGVSAERGSFLTNIYHIIIHIYTLRKQNI